MRVIKTIKPGQNGSQRFVERYGERLVSVRHREDHTRKYLLTTIELIVDQRDYLPGINQTRYLNERDKQWVAVKIAYDEVDLRNRAKSKGAQ